MWLSTNMLNTIEIKQMTFKIAIVIQEVETNQSFVCVKLEAL